jgi:lipopolysaccharide biosynthesis protein
VTVEADTHRETGRSKIRSIAFYLPQFHPIPENDAWWGEGFTEWRNVMRATPRFRGHYQPHLPGELGFYDLREPATRTRQADLGRGYGVDGFCYYHYWFHGRRLLERPFEEVLSSGEPDFPFCLCWANENWTRVWDGGPHEMLMPQTYSQQDDLDHIRALAPAFADPRCLRVEGRPLFLVYQASHLPDPRRTTETWRQEAIRLGIGEPYLCRVEGHGPDRGDPIPLGFDAAVEFQPDVNIFPPVLHRSPVGRAWRKVLDPNSGVRWNAIFDYDALVSRALAKKKSQYKRFPCVMPNWDNTARRERGARIFRGSTPSKYGNWLRQVVDGFEPYSATENLVFVNAWNEWAEGNHLEPDARWGRAYLEAHAEALGRTVADEAGRSLGASRVSQ